MTTGASRFENARRKGYGDHWLTSKDAENDRLAHEAELFVARRYGLPEPAADLGHPDEGWDFLLAARNGNASCSINVKWTPHETGGLYLPAHRALKALVYMLVTGPEGGMVIRGFAWRHMVKLGRIVDKGYGPGHFLDQSELHTSVDLLMALHGYGVTTETTAPRRGRG